MRKVTTDHWARLGRRDLLARLAPLAVLAVLLSGCAGQEPGVPVALAAGSATAATPAVATTPATPATTTTVATSVEATKTQTISSIESKKAVDAAKALTAAAMPGSNAYKIGPQDVLDISVFQVPDLQRTVQVADSGTVNLPLVGDVQAVGLTAQQVEQDLTKRLGAKYLQSPQVTVSVKEFNSQRVTVDGAVAKPGVYPIRGHATLLEMVSTAGGMTESSDETNIVVFRNTSGKTDGKRTAAAFDYAAIRAGTVEDPQLQQGDVVVVNSSKFKEAMGNVLKALPLTKLFVPLL
jgi:polysaccharide biosynthesis/export protein